MNERALSSEHDLMIVEMAKVAISGLITSCSGVLIAILAFSGQAYAKLDASGAGLIEASIKNAGAALIVSLLTAFLGLVSQIVYSYRYENRAIWYAAAVSYWLSVVLVGYALIQAGQALL